MIDLSDPDTYAAAFPYDTFRELRSREPVSRRTEPIAKTYWAVTRYQDVLTVLRNPALYSSARGGSMIGDPPQEFLVKMREGMLHRDPPEHTVLRRIANKAFTPRRISELESRIAAHAKLLVDRIVDRRECDFVKEVASEMPLFVICEILGVPVEDRLHLNTLTERMLETPVVDKSGSMQDTMAAVAEMRAYGAALGERKRKERADDLVSDLLSPAGEDGMLTPGEFEALFLLLFNAGSDTTRSLLGFGLDLLLARPGILGELVGNPILLPRAIEEMLRYESPVIQFRRTTTQDVVLGGQHIGEGEKVLVFFPSANRDESAFPNPDLFDINRTPNEHLSFGSGTHFCLGATLARLEAKHVFLQIFNRLKKIERASPLVTARSNFVRGVKSLKISYQT